jgi:hypothetical protein
MGVIDLQEAKDMVKKYAETRRALIDKTYHIRDTKAIWFSVDEMKAFVDGLTPDVTGVRFYLAVNEPDNILYPDQTTIILIGTVDDGTGKNVDPIGQPSGPPGSGGGVGQIPFNHGSLCPPGTDCA